MKIRNRVLPQRLEPRVELREGYWVLKEKFRQGINPSEKVKIEKEPMKLITEDGINGRFMMRLKLPNRVTTSAQTRYLASVIKKYGEDGCADVTTRQNWQIRGVVL